MLLTCPSMGVQMNRGLFESGIGMLGYRLIDEVRTKEWEDFGQLPSMINANSG